MKKYTVIFKAGGAKVQKIVWANGYDGVLSVMFDEYGTAVVNSFDYLEITKS